MTAFQIPPTAYEIARDAAVDHTGPTVRTYRCATCGLRLAWVEQHAAGRVLRYRRTTHGQIEFSNPENAAKYRSRSNRMAAVRTVLLDWRPVDDMLTAEADLGPFVLRCPQHGDADLDLVAAMREQRTNVRVPVHNAA